MHFAKRTGLLVLAAVLLLTLTACGGTAQRRFDPEALTPAEQVASAAVAEQKFPAGWELKEVDVLQTEDLAAAIGSNVDLSAWDVSDAAYAVILRAGEKADEAEDDDETSAANAQTAGLATVVMLVDDEFDVVYCSGKFYNYDFGDERGDADADADGFDVQAARYDLVKAELKVEEYAAEHAETVQAFQQAVAPGLDTDPDYARTADYLVTAQAMNATDYTDLVEVAWCLQLRLDILEAAENGSSGLTRAEAVTAADTQVSLEQQRWTLLGEWAKVEQERAQLEADRTADIAGFEAKAAEMQAADPDYLDSEDYLKLCLSSDEFNRYDTCLRQIELYRSTVETLDNARELSDRDEMDLVCALKNDQNQVDSDYINARKTYAQCLLNQEQFEAEHQTELAAYDEALAAARERAGDDYATDMDFIKADVQYGGLIRQREAHSSAVAAAKADAEQILADGEAGAAELRQKYADRMAKTAEEQAQQALVDYARNLKVTVGEYEAEPGQWCRLPQAYLDDQNDDLPYHVSHSHSSGSSHSGSSSGGTGSGGYDMPRDGESFSDYVKRVDPDLYESMQDIYNDAVG